MQSKYSRGVYVFLLVLIFPVLASSQDIVSGFAGGQGKADLAFAFTYESYDQFYRGEELVDLPPVLRKIHDRNLVGLFCLRVNR